MLPTLSQFLTNRVMTEQPIATFEGLLRRYPAFHDLGDDRLRWLAARSRPFHCTVGQELLSMTGYLSIVFVLLKDAVVYCMTIQAFDVPSRSLTPARDLIGWSGLVRRTPCEWVTAATPQVDWLQSGRLLRIGARIRAFQPLA